MDACSNASTSGCIGTYTNEGLSEMVLFKVGASSLNVSGLTVNWPNNTFSSWLAPNALTAANVAYLNSTILSCGAILEPTLGVLPANKRILAITSASMCLVGNSFANLSDTLIVIFQSGSILSGHFTNHNNSGSATPLPTGSTDTRTLSLIYSANSCTNTVVYDRSLLTNTLGTYGGINTMNDGASVVVSSTGVLTYTNEGCKAPFIPLSIMANTNSTTCANTSLLITSTVSGGSFNNITWYGGTGTFATTSGTNTSNTYTPGVGETGVVTLSATVSRTCTGGGSTASTIYTFAIIQTPTLGLNTNTFSICGTQSANIVASSQAGNTYSWNTLATTNSISVSPASTTIYTVTAINTCSTISTTATVTPGAANSITTSASSNTLCAGNSAILTATSSAGTYSWNTGATTNSIVVSPTSTTNYSVTSNGCTTVSAFQTITVTPIPNLTIILNR